VQHLSGELFQRLTGVQMLHVPYKGIGPAVNDLVGGQVQLGIESMAAILSHIRAGKLRALMVGSRERVPYLPDVPTPAEAGPQGLRSWHPAVFLCAGRHSRADARQAEEIN
jgi:tripartite-type tricarboxylate transporter receptor subunit TctC